MEENYGRKAAAWLPPLRITGLDRPPVIHVANEITGEIIYTLRIKGNRYQPAVFEEGTYTIQIGEPGTPAMKTISGIIAGTEKGQEEVEVSFTGN